MSLLCPTDEDIAFELHRHRGKLSQTAKALGTHSMIIRQRIRENPEVLDAYLHSRDMLVDMAEEVLYKMLLAGSERAVMYVLSTLGKDRGYTERHELTGKDGAELSVTLNLGNNRINSNEDTLESLESFDESELENGDETLRVA